MPIYQYRCKDCGKIKEVMQKITDKPLVDCPFCKGVLRKIIAPVGLIFKGSGFHVTDYKGKSDSSVSETVPKEITKTTTKAKEKKDKKAKD